MGKCIQTHTYILIYPHICIHKKHLKSYYSYSPNMNHKGLQVYKNVNVVQQILNRYFKRIKRNMSSFTHGRMSQFTFILWKKRKDALNGDSCPKFLFQFNKAGKKK